MVVGRLSDGCQAIVCLEVAVKQSLLKSGVRSAAMGCVKCI